MGEIADQSANTRWCAYCSWPQTRAGALSPCKVCDRRVFVSTHMLAWTLTPHDRRFLKSLQIAAE